MRILHFSDLHGAAMREAESLIQTHEPDWIVLTGDMLPDFNRLPGTARRLEAQREWWRAWRNVFIRTGTPTTFVRGNHEVEGFEDRVLRSVPAALTGKVGLLEGIPARWGAWGFAREWGDQDLAREVRALKHPFVILSHVPPYGWLDRNSGGASIGHPPLRELLDPSEESTPASGASRGLTLGKPALVLCGHVHESFGWERHGPTLVVNAATGHALVDLDLDSGTAEVRGMKRMLAGRPDPYP